MKEINGKVYPLWSQFVEKKSKFIGGILEDFGDTLDRGLGLADHSAKTTITDITLNPNGEESAFFSIEGEDFSCGFDAQCGGVIGGEEGFVTFSGYGGHLFRIKQSENADDLLAEQEEK